jgi:hypothetical protein
VKALARPIGIPFAPLIWRNRPLTDRALDLPPKAFTVSP